jgi:hypothetical protein
MNVASEGKNVRDCWLLKPDVGFIVQDKSECVFPLKDDTGFVLCWHHCGSVYTTCTDHTSSVGKASVCRQAVLHTHLCAKQSRIQNFNGTLTKPFFFRGATAQILHRPPHFWGFTFRRTRPLELATSHQHTTNTTDEHPSPQRDSNPWSQKWSVFRPKH